MTLTAIPAPAPPTVEEDLHLRLSNAADVVLINAVDLAAIDIRRGLSATARQVLSEAVRVADRLLAASVTAERAA